MMRYLFAFLLFLFMGVAWALAPPLPGMQIYGNVPTAKNGTEIRAIVDGNSFVTYVEGKTFGYAPSVFIVQGEKGDTVSIYVGGKLFGTYTYVPGGLLEINVPSTFAFCGDGKCGNGETYASCPLDCPKPPEKIAPAAPERVVEKTFETNGVIVHLYNTEFGTFAKILSAVPTCGAVENAFTYAHVEVNGDYEYGTITFIVPVSWFTDNDLNVNTADILRCAAGEWEHVGVDHMSKEGNNYVFVSKHTTFSTLALVAQPNIIKKPAKEEKKEKTRETQTKESKQVKKTTEKKETVTKKSNITGFATLENTGIIAGAVIVLIVIGYAIYRRI